MITYYIENKRGERLELEQRQNYRRDPLEFKPEKSLYARQGQFGVISRGTFKQASKEINLKFDIVEESIEQYYYQINRIGAFLYDQRNSPFYLYSVERGSRAKISISEIKENYSEGMETKLGLNCSLKVTMEDALWESISEVPEIVTLFNGDSFDIELREDSVDSAGIFKIKNLDSSPNTEFALQLTNGSTVQNIIIAPVGFNENEIITLDCFNGTIRLGNQFIQNRVIAGGFFPLLPGINTILYECPSNQEVEIQSAYRIRRLI
jgi:hypothetical protein